MNTRQTMDLVSSLAKSAKFRELEHIQPAVIERLNRFNKKHPKFAGQCELLVNVEKRKPELSIEFQRIPTFSEKQRVTVLHFIFFDLQAAGIAQPIRIRDCDLPATQGHIIRVVLDVCDPQQGGENND